MKTHWSVYQCDCGQEYAIKEVQGDEIEEPCCPVCGDHHSAHLGFLDLGDAARAKIARARFSAERLVDESRAYGNDCRDGRCEM